MKSFKNLILFSFYIYSISSFAINNEEYTEFDTRKLMVLLTQKSLNTEIFKRDLPLCDENRLFQNLADMQITDPEKIVTMATYENLDENCRQISENLVNMASYLEYCNPPYQAELYKNLTKGVNCLFQKLCLDSSFRKDFLNEHECIKSKAKDFEICKGKADWVEESDQQVCREYGNIVGCYLTTAELCGKRASEVMGKLTQYVIDSVVAINCGGLKSPDACVKELMPPKEEIEKKYGPKEKTKEKNRKQDEKISPTKEKNNSKECHSKKSLVIFVFLIHGVSIYNIKI